MVVTLDDRKEFLRLSKILNALTEFKGKNHKHNDDCANFLETKVSGDKGLHLKTTFEMKQKLVHL